MQFVQFYIICVFGFLPQKAMAEAPKFRILAPSIVCPKDKTTDIDKPKNTVVTLQTDTNVNLTFSWRVRNEWLVDPTQRLTIATWKSLRSLDRMLNGPQIEPGVYIIDNDELLSGVKYIFDVTATSRDSTKSVKKTFTIDNINRDEITLTRRFTTISIVLFGCDLIYTDMEYITEALVSTCEKLYDYYFVWSVTSGKIKVDVSHVRGTRLVIQPHTLIAGLTYNVCCKVFKYSNGHIFAENELSFRVLHRELNINFNIDLLVISVDTPFNIQTNIKTLDYLPNDLTITWVCSYNNKYFDDFITDDDGRLLFPSGLPHVGEYIVSVTVSAMNKLGKSSSSARIITVKEKLPVIKVALIPRATAENSFVTLKADVSNVVPGCTITWHFAYDQCRFPTNTTYTNMCNANSRGSIISKPVTFYSLEENFLNELTDYSNETISKSVVAVMQAATGTATIITRCQCNNEKPAGCASEGDVYAELELRVNKEPGEGEIQVTPTDGIAMETMFRIRTRAVGNLNRLLRYTFYADLGNNESLILGTYLDHLAIETLLPYVDGGISLRVEICDSLGGCSVGKSVVVQQCPGEARTLETLTDDVKMFVRRCEIEYLQRLVISAIVTYINTGQSEARTIFVDNLWEALQNMEQICIDSYYEQYMAFLNWVETRTYATATVLY